MRAIIDTNVVFEGITKKGNASGYCIEAWLAGLFKPCVSSALAFEYTDVLSRKLSGMRWRVIKPVLSVLLSKAEFVPIYFTWRPSSPDPADDHLIDCAMNAGAPIVTWNIKDFRDARTLLGLSIMTPAEFLNLLAE
jgi:predicted nucleic acid-binding protein